MRLRLMLKWLLAIALLPLLAAHALAFGCAPGQQGASQIVVTQTSGNVANASAAATLPAPAAAQRWNITRIEIEAAGATAAAAVNATLSGLDGGAGAAVTAAYPFVFVAGVAAASTPIVFDFTCPLVGLPGTAVTLTLPAGGSGNTNASVNLHGFVQ